MKVKAKVSKEKEKLQYKLKEQIRYGDLQKVKDMVAAGADVYYEDDYDGYNALSYAIYLNKYDAAKYLLEMGMGKDKIVVGTALICAETPEAVKLLAKYAPDCSVTAPNGFTAVDWFIVDEQYETLKAYDECGFVRPPINKKVIRKANREFNLRQWAAAMNVRMDEESCKKCDTKMSVLHYYEIKDRKTLFRKCVREA